MPGTFAYTKSTNVVVVTGGTSGSPADFASMLTADRAGTVTLLAAWSPNNNTKALTYQITPCELRALLISFVVASKTTQTDYIFITGTDAWDAAQTESINVSAGNGTYTSTKRFRTITNISCSDNAAGGGTLWADGTVLVRQPQWGVIWDYSAVAAYRIDSKLEIGDGSTATYFADSYKIILFDPNIPTGHFQIVIKVTANATFVLGTLIDADRKLVADPCLVSMIGIPYTTYGLYSYSTGNLYLYGTVIFGSESNPTWLVTYETGRLWNTLHANDLPYCGGDTSLFGVKCFAADKAVGSLSCEVSGFTSIGDLRAFNPALYCEIAGDCSDIKLYGHNYVFIVTADSITGTFNLIDVQNYPTEAVGEFQDLWLGDGSVDYPYATGGHYHLGIVGNMVQFAWDATAATVQTGLEGVFGVGNVTVTDYDYPGYPDAWSLGIQFDPRVGDSNLVVDTTALTGGGWYDLEILIGFIEEGYWASYFDIGSDAIVNRLYTFDIKVCDKDGISISGAVVDCEDENGDPCWTAGTVTTDVSGDITQRTILYKKYTAGAGAFTPTIVTYSPHKFTISKAGYKTLMLDNIWMSEPVSWHVELQPYEGQAQSRIVSIGVM